MAPWESAPTPGKSMRNSALQLLWQLTHKRGFWRLPWDGSSAARAFVDAAPCARAPTKRSARTPTSFCRLHSPAAQNNRTTSAPSGGSSRRSRGVLERRPLDTPGRDGSAVRLRAIRALRRSGPFSALLPPAHGRRVGIWGFCVFGGHSSHLTS